jgi:hypothetical protein
VLDAGQLDDPSPQWAADAATAHPEKYALARIQWRVARAVIEQWGDDAPAELSSRLHQSRVRVSAKLRGAEALQPHDLADWAKQVPFSVVDVRIASGVELSSLPSKWRWVLDPERVDEPAHPSLLLATGWHELAAALAERVNAYSREDLLRFVTDASIAFAALEHLPVVSGFDRADAFADEEVGGRISLRRGARTAAIDFHVWMDSAGLESRWGDDLLRLYRRVAALSEAPIAERYFVLAAGRRSIRQIKGWNPVLGTSGPSALLKPVQDEVDRLGLSYQLPPVEVVGTHDATASTVLCVRIAHG